MKNMSKFIAVGLLAALSAFAQQNSLTATTTAATMTANSRTINLTSATGVVAPTVSTPGSQLWVQDLGQTFGEVMNVLSISGTVAQVARTSGQTVGHKSGALVVIGQPNWFYKFNPTGTCTAAQVYVTPWLNTQTGQQFLCGPNGVWVGGWQNTGVPLGVGAAVVASAAGATAISAPLQHVSGTNAITSFTMGTGWYGGGFCIIPDGAYTTVAGNNIAVATTGVANKTQCWTWDSTNSKFTASY